METIIIGNWTITDEGIRWCGTPQVNCFISKDRLAETGVGDRANMYNWLVHMVEKT